MKEFYGNGIEAYIDLPVLDILTLQKIDEYSTAICLIPHYYNGRNMEWGSKGFALVRHRI